MEDISTPPFPVAAPSGNRRGRPRGFDRDAALARAMDLFWRKGFAATSVAELCAVMGVNAPSLYAAFGSKEALFEAALQLYACQMTPQLWAGFDAAPTAREAVMAMLTAAAHTLPASDRPAGCMVTLSALRDEGCDRLAETVKGARAAIREKIAARLRQAVAAGELPPDADVEGIARFYVGVHQGMSVQARDGATAAELMALARGAMAAWEPLTAAGAPVEGEPLATGIPFAPERR